MYLLMLYSFEKKIRKIYSTGVFLVNIGGNPSIFTKFRGFPGNTVFRKLKKNPLSKVQRCNFFRILLKNKQFSTKWYPTWQNCITFKENKITGIYRLPELRFFPRLNTGFGNRFFHENITKLVSFDSDNDLRKKSGKCFFKQIF